MRTLSNLAVAKLKTMHKLFMPTSVFCAVGFQMFTTVSCIVWKYNS